MQEKDLAINLPLQVSEMAKALVFAGISILSFFVPFTLGHPQWLVGAAVNACLFLTAIFLPKKYFLPVIVLPSLGVLARGLVFGPFTIFLVYFLPFIWLGNLALILTFSYLLGRPAVRFAGLKFVFGVCAGALVKFLLLFLIANLYFNFHIVPKIFIATMGLNQLATALAGGAAALVIIKIYGSLNKRS